MHQISPKIQSMLLDVHKEWMRAEACIKQSEQINNAVVIPAIKELRYAGRCLINALNLLMIDGDVERAQEYLLDAKFDTNRARHDAVDAMVSKIAIDLESMVISVGAKAILKEVPNFGDIVGRLNRVRSKIVVSRTHKQDRNAVYQDIEDNDVNALVQSMQSIKYSSKIMLAIARAQDVRQRFAYVFGIVGVVIGAICLLYVKLSVR